MKQLFTLIIILSTQIGISQEAHWNDQLLESTGGKKVLKWEQASNNNEVWFVTVKHKKLQGMYMVEICETYAELGEEDSTYICSSSTVIQPKYTKISPFIPVATENLNPEYVSYGDVEIAFLETKKSKGIVYRWNDMDYEFFEPTLFFDEIDTTYSNGTQFAVQKNDKWGIYDWYEQVMIVQCEFETIADFPKTSSSKGLDSYTMEIYTAFNKQKDVEKIDWIDMDGNNGDGLFKARSSATKKWGLYQYLGDEIVEAIPMKYDSLYHFSWNGNYTAVFNDGKVGFYLSYWSYETAKESVPCIYEDYKRFKTEDQTPRLAVKKDGKWGWVDWLTGKPKSEFKYETPDDLPYPYYQQNIYPEDE